MEREDRKLEKNNRSGITEMITPWTNTENSTVYEAESEKETDLLISGAESILIDKLLDSHDLQRT